MGSSARNKLLCVAEKVLFGRPFFVSFIETTPAYREIPYPIRIIVVVADSPWDEPVNVPVLFGLVGPAKLFHALRSSRVHVCFFILASPR